MANTYTQLYVHIVFEEYLAFLERFGVAYDVKYVFDSVADPPPEE